MKNTTLTSIIAAIVGGLYFETFFPVILISFYILDTRFKNSFLFLFSIYVLLFGYFFNPLDSSILLIAAMIIIPHLTVLYELLSGIEQKYAKIDIVIVICLFLGIIYKEAFLFGSLLLLTTRFKNYFSKKIAILLIPIVLFALVLIKYSDIVNQNIIYKIMVVIGLGICMYSFYSYLNQDQAI
ncbi:hypothetical protein [Methanococcus sp. CF]